MASNIERNQPKELIDLIDRKGNKVSVGLPFSEAMRRIQESYHENGESHIGVEVVHMWLARSEGAKDDPIIILQRRSDNHRLDKTVGGHVSSGETAEATIRKETSEEMGVAGLKVAPQLGQGALAGVDLSRDVMVVKAGFAPWEVSGRHDRDGSYYEKPTQVHTYIGFFDGDLNDLKPDFEVDGFVAMPLSQIMTGLAEYPDQFTPDVIALVAGIGLQIQEAASAN